MKTKFFSLSAVAAVALFSHAAFAEVLSLKTGYDYSSGDYGSDTTTEITSIPFIANYEKGDWSFKAVVPYLRISGASNVVSGVGAVASASGGTRTASGWGDITLSATHAAFIDLQSQTGLDITGKVKLGTANEDKGLGTGENDYWVLADLYKRVGAVTYFGGVGYGVLGDSEDLKLKNVVSSNVGALYKLNQTSSVGASFDARTKSTDDGDPQRELTAFYLHKFAGGYKLQAYALKGFADGSPDWGGGLNFGYSY